MNFSKTINLSLGHIYQNIYNAAQQETRFGKNYIQLYINKALAMSNQEERLI